AELMSAPNSTRRIARARIFRMRALQRWERSESRAARRSAPQEIQAAIRIASSWIRNSDPRRKKKPAELTDVDSVIETYGSSQPQKVIISSAGGVQMWTSKNKNGSAPAVLFPIRASGTHHERCRRMHSAE